MVLNFVTEICSDFLELKIMFWNYKFRTLIENDVLDFEFCTEICSNFLERKKKNKVLVLNYVCRTVQTKMKLVWYKNNVKFYTKPVLLFS